jgi:multisubunit Na+/H+ antiporter MnhB subunit
MTDMATVRNAPPGTPRRESDDAATRVFSTSILISATRCVLTYVVFPWLLPIVGLTRGVGPAVGLVIGVVAIGFNIASIRRFHRAAHRWRWPISALNAAVVVLLLVAVVQDIANIGS